MTGTTRTFCEPCQGYHDGPACLDVEPTTIATRDDADGAGWYRMAVFPRALVESTYGEISPETADSVLRQICPWFAFGRRPGGPYANPPSMRVTRTRVVVRQSGGLDI